MVSEIVKKRIEELKETGKYSAYSPQVSTGRLNKIQGPGTGTPAISPGQTKNVNCKVCYADQVINRDSKSYVCDVCGTDQAA